MFMTASLPYMAILEYTLPFASRCLAYFKKTSRTTHSGFTIARLSTRTSETHCMVYYSSSESLTEAF